MANFPTTYLDGSVTRHLPNPSRPLTENTKYNIITFEADSGHQQRREKAPPKKTWDLNYLVLTKLQADAIESFFNQQKGPLSAFYWTHPVDKVTYYVRFANDTLTKKNIGHNLRGPLYSLELKLEQAFL